MAANKKAERAVTPTANVFRISDGRCGGPRRRTQEPGTKAVEVFIGTALRHCRAGLAIALCDGPDDRVARELQRARDALDSGLWLCSYCEADK